MNTPRKRKAKGSKPKGYDADSIQTLEGMEAVRKRPGMYIGGTGSDGLSHLLWELIDNGVDEAAAGHADQIEVIFHKDGSLEVTDNGRGIPVGRHAGKKVSALEVVFTELHAGGKFGGGAYAASGGLHGVGASVVNALSHQLTVEVDREAHTHRLTFVEREPGRFKGEKFTPTHTLERLKKIPARRTGTRVRFWPDFEIFDPDATIDYDSARERAARMCFLVPGLRIKLADKRTGSTHKPEEFISTGGLSDLVEYLSAGENITDIIDISGMGTFEEKVPVDGRMQVVTRECQVDVAMRWVKGYEASVQSFVNTIPTSEGGTHLAGFERAMTRVVNDLLVLEAKKLRRLKDQGKVTRDDVQEGMVAAVKVTFPEPQFRGQTKQELGTPGVGAIVSKVVRAGVADWVQTTGKKSHVNALRDKVVNATITRVTQRQQRETMRQASSLGSTGMPDKLADCRSHNGNSELLIVEGDSAAGPAKAGRNSEIQAVLPIRGKIINAGKATMKQVLDNTEAAAIFTSLGAGSGVGFDLAACRYDRLVILADADVDGSHIRCLLLTLIHHYMKPLLEAGRVYVAMPPLFTVKETGKAGAKHFCYDEIERDRLVAELEAKGQNFTVGRNKGLGEMDVDELAFTTLEPASRVLRRVTVADAAEQQEAAEAFETLMGKEVEPRREFIINNSGLLDMDELDV